MLLAGVTLKQPRDSQRSKLYRAEGEAFPDGKRGGMSYAEAVAYVRQVWRSPWTRRNFSRARTYGVPYVADGRGTTHAYAGLGRISLPRWARTKPVILHEIAHVLHGSSAVRQAAHGREYAAIYLRLVQHWMGVDAAAALKRAFRRNRVKYTPKRVLSPLQLEDLRKRGRALAAARQAPSQIRKIARVTVVVHVGPPPGRRDRPVGPPTRSKP